jgi:uncharacterized RDD family membrane protein YckC
MPDNDGADAEPQGRVRLAGAGARFVAFLLDSVLLFFSLPLWILALGLPAQTVMPDAYAGIVAVAIGFVGYFSVSWALGGSVGMLLMSIRLARAPDGTPPGLLRSTARAAMVGLPLASFVMLIAAGFSDSPDDESEAAVTVLMGVMSAVFVLGSCARLTLFFDKRRQSLIDHTAGTLVVSSSPRHT